MTIQDHVLAIERQHGRPGVLCHPDDEAKVLLMGLPVRTSEYIGPGCAYAADFVSLFPTEAEMRAQAATMLAHLTVQATRGWRYWLS